MDVFAIKKSAANQTASGIIPQIINGTGIKILFSFAVMGLLVVMPPVAPLSAVGMDVLGVFIGTILLLSLVDTTWPAILSIALFSMTGVMPLEDIIAASFGNWITIFVIMGFILTYALNHSGFTGRLTVFFLSSKIARHSPWSFTIVLICLPFLVASFMEPSATIVFFLGFARKIFESLGYKKTDRYPHMVTMAIVFAASIASSMTPISHPLIVLGLNFYQQTTSQTINLVSYMLYAVPIGILVFAAMLVVLRLFFKPDMSKITHFEIESVLDQFAPMTKQEKITVVTFFATVIMWILPAILSMFAPHFAFSIVLNKFGVTYWAILAVVFLTVVRADGRPVLDLKTALTEGVNWNVIFLVASCVLMGAVVTNEAVGLNQFILGIIEPVTKVLPPVLEVLFLVGLTGFLTNFTSNMTAMVLMLSVGLSLASGMSAVDPVAVTLAIIAVSDFAFIVPSSSNLIGMLYGDEYSNGNTVFQYGSVLAIIGIFIVALIGYPFSFLLA